MLGKTACDVPCIFQVCAPTHFDTLTKALVNLIRTETDIASYLLCPASDHMTQPALMTFELQHKQALTSDCVNAVTRRQADALLRDALRSLHSPQEQC